MAGLYLGRALRKTVIIDDGKPRARWIPKIRNLIGYREGLSGTRLLERMRNQVKLYKIDFAPGRAVVNTARDGFEITVGRKIIKAKKVILATGMIDVQPQIGNINFLRKKGLLAYCPICDGYEYRNDVIALMIDGIYGLRKIEFLLRLIPKLHVVAIKEFPLPSEYKKLIKKNKIKFYQGELMGLDCVDERLQISLKNSMPLFYKLAYVLLGAQVEDSAFGHLKNLQRTNEGFLTVSTHQETNIPGLYAVGDCVHGLSQVSVAVGQAAIAAVHVNNCLEN